MTDVEQIIEELKALRRSRKWSIRELAKKSGVGRTKLTDLERNKRPLHVDDLFAILTACDLKPVLWLAQWITDRDSKVRDRDRELTKLFQRAMRTPLRREVIDKMLTAWSVDDERFDESQR